MFIELHSISYPKPSFREKIEVKISR
ncbi:hypothetical protein Pmani_011924, partial [Petrolisthes manimaculis]